MLESPPHQTSFRVSRSGHLAMLLFVLLGCVLAQAQTPASISGTIIASGSVVPIELDSSGEYILVASYAGIASSSKAYSLSTNGSLYRNQSDAYSTVSLDPSPQPISASPQSLTSGNAKLINTIRAAKGLDAQVIALYQAPDLLPQGRISVQYAVDAGLSLRIQNGRGELTLNATDLFETLIARRDVQAAGFHYPCEDYAETQAIRLGYRYSFKTC